MIRRQAAACYNHVDMRMKLEVLPPGMQDSCNSRRCAEIFPVRAQFQHSFGGRLKQQRIHRTLLLAKNWAQLRRNGEYNVEIRCVEKIFSLLVDPRFFCKTLAFRTMPVPAGIVGDPHMSAVIAGIYMRPQGGSPAVDDISRSLPLDTAHLAILNVRVHVPRKNILNLNAHCRATDQRDLQGLPQCSPNAGKP